MLFLCVVTKSDGDPRVPPVPSARRGELLRGRQRALLAPVPARAPDRPQLTESLLRLPQWSTSIARQPDVRRR